MTYEEFLTQFGYDPRGGGIGSEKRQAIADAHDDTRTWVTPKGYRLSDRLWAAGRYERMGIEEVLREGIALGTDTEQIGRNLRQYALDPHSGGYPMRRLARTEIMRASGKGTIDAAKANPFVTGVTWRTSGRHRGSDQCDTNAANSPFAPSKVPRYPNHPMCRCVLIPVAEKDPQRLARKLRKELDAMGIQPEVPTELPPAPAAATKLQDAVAKAKAAMKGQVSEAEAAIREAGRLFREDALARIDPAKRALLAEYRTLKLRDLEIDKIKANTRAYNKLETQEKLDLSNEQLQLATRMKGIKEEYALSPEDALRFREAQALADQGRDIQNAIFRGKLEYTPENLDEVKRLYAESKAIKDSVNAVRSNPLQAATREALSEVRTMGTDKRFTWVKGSQKKSTSVIDEATTLFPADWIEAGIAYTPRGAISKMITRGHYRDLPVPEVHLSGTGNDALDTAVHEVTHMMERAVPNLNMLEGEFWRRRTAGERPRWLGPGYGKSEVSILDDFAHPYIGKDYGGRAYEVATMGVEDALRHGALPDLVTVDEDFGDFIYGILAVL